jgi:hypothetical protein
MPLRLTLPRRAERFMLLLACAWLTLPVAPMGAHAAAQVAPLDQTGAVAQDTALNRVYVAQPVGNMVLVLAAGNMSLRAVLKVPGSPAAIAVDPNRHRVYVASDPSGVISAFDGRTDRLLRRVTVGGHPAGLALTDRGTALLITDRATGAVQRMPVLPALGSPQQVLALGADDGAENVLLAPTSTWGGQQALVWSRGFQPHEPVVIYWGIHILKHLTADAAGFVVTHITVPASRTKSALGDHLVIVMGQQSMHSESTLLTVIPAPPPPKRVPHKPARHSSTDDALHRLLAPRLVLSVPRVSGPGPLKHLPTISAHPSVPAFPIVALLVLICCALIVHSGRRRRKRAKLAPPIQPKTAPKRRRPAARAAGRAS